MKLLRSNKMPRILLGGAILLVVILSSSDMASANPGFVPGGDGEMIYVDFSDLPDGSPIRQGFNAWHAQGWNGGTRCMQLIHEGAYLEVMVEIPENVSTARLTIAHRSAYAPGCANNGFAPVTLRINGAVLTQYYAPPADVPWSADFTADRWDLTHWLSPGRNRIRITAKNLCSVYEINRIEISITTTTSHLIEDYQMTHNIDDLRPTDRTTIFTPNDQWAVCWTKVTPEAIGRRIEFRFYDPLGDLYFKAHRIADHYNWGSIKVRNWRAATLQGPWRVDIYIAGEFQMSVPFTINSTGNSVSSPRVTLVEFPNAIRADGEKNQGYVSFFDPNADITSVRFDVVNAVRFNSFGFEPDVRGKISGSFSFRIWSTIRQTVTLQVTLIDRFGNTSEPYYFRFNAT